MKRFLLITLYSLLITASAVYAFDPGVYDVTMYAGEDFKLTLLLKDSTGAAMNLTGSTYAAQFRSAPAPAGTVFATYSASAPTPANGQIEVKLSRAQTAINTGKAGMWDLRQTGTTGLVSYLLTGKAAVKPTVTR